MATGASGGASSGSLLCLSVHPKGMSLTAMTRAVDSRLRGNDGEVAGLLAQRTSGSPRA